MPRSIPMIAAALALLAAPLAAQGTSQPRLARDLDRLAADRDRLARAGRSQARLAGDLARLASGRDGAARRPLADAPPPAAFPQDPADGLYRQGRDALNREEWTTAARRFQQIRQSYPRSRYA